MLNRVRPPVLQLPPRGAGSVALVVAAFSLGAPAARGQLAFTPLNVPGATATTATRVNGAGQVVGFYADAAGTHGFLFSGGAFTRLDVPGAITTSPFGINATGMISGEYTDASGTHGFLYAGGVYTPLNVPGAIRTLGRALNDAGQVAGIYHTGTTVATAGHAFVYADGVFRFLPDVPGATGTFGSGINDAGQVTGTYGPFEAPSPRRGFVYADGEFSFIDFPGAISTFVPEINAAGQMAGRYVDAAGRDRGWVYSGGAFTSYDVPGATGTSAFSVNDAGQIVGWYDDAAGRHGYLTTIAAVTAPEPGTVTLLAVGLGGLAAGARRRVRRSA